MTDQEQVDRMKPYFAAQGEAAREVSRMVDEIAVLKAELAEARKDTARLDSIQAWLVDNPRVFQASFRRLESTGEFLYRRETNPGSFVNVGGLTLREAIDAIEAGYQKAKGGQL